MKLPPRLADGGVALLLGRDVEPGTDPHQVKGVAYRGHLDFIGSEMPGGLKAHREALEALPMVGSEQLREFFDQTFFASSTYDVFPLAIAGIACARMTGETFMDFVVRRTRQQVDKDISGVHKFLIKIVSAKMVASRLPRLLTQYMNFTEVEVERPESDHVSAQIKGIPLALGGWFLAVLDTYMRTVLKMAGATDATVESQTVIDEDPNRAIIVLDVRFPS